MGRTGEQENKDAQKQMAATQAAHEANVQADRAAYLKKLSELEAKGNPYESADYKQTENLLASEGAGAANNAGLEAVDSAVGHTGTNTTSEPYYRSMMAKDRMRAQGSVLTRQKAADTENANQWNQWLTGAKLAPSGIDTSMFSAATNGRNAALGNLTSIGNSTWNNLTALGTAAISGAGQAGSAALKACWIAEAIYGVDDPRTHLMRYWMNHVWAKESKVGALVMKVYLAIGQSVAKLVRRSLIVRSMFQPLFDAGLRRAQKWSRG